MVCESGFQYCIRKLPKGAVQTRKKQLLTEMKTTKKRTGLYRENSQKERLMERVQPS